MAILKALGHWAYTNILVVAMTGVVVAVVTTMVNNRFTRKSVKFLSIDVRTPNIHHVGADPYTEVGFRIVNDGGRTIQIRNSYFVSRGGIRSADSPTARNMQVDEDANFQSSCSGQNFNINDIDKVIVIDSAEDSYTGYLYKGRFVSRWKRLLTF